MFETGFLHEVQIGLKLTVFLPLFLQCWMIGIWYWSLIDCPLSILWYHLCNFEIMVHLKVNLMGFFFGGDKDFIKKIYLTPHLCCLNSLSTLNWLWDFYFYVEFSIMEKKILSLKNDIIKSLIRGTLKAHKRKR